MKIRFDVEAIQKTVENKFRKYSAICLEAVVRFRALLIGLLLIFGLLSVPEFVVKIFQRENIKNHIEEFIEQVPLAVSYDGMTFGAYGGIELYNLRVSSESDFSRERVLLQTPVLRINFDIIDIVFNRKWTINTVEIDRGAIELQSEQSGQNRELLTRFLALVKKANSPVIIFSDAKFIFKNNHDENNFIWKFRRINGFIRSDEKSVLLNLHMSDPNWGEADMEYSSAQCENCLAGHGNYKVAFSDLPMAYLQDIFSEYVFERGEVEGRLQVVYLPGKEKIVDVTGDVKLNDMKLKRGEEFFLECSLANLHGGFNTDKNEWNLTLDGTWDKSEIDFKLSKSPKSDWPNLFRLSLKPEVDSQLYFPYGYVVGGLNDFTIEIEKVKGRLDKFIIKEASVKWNKGFIRSLNYKPFDLNIENADISMKENEFEAKATFIKNRSDITFSAQGSIEAFMKNAIISYYRYGRVEKRSSYRTIPVLRISANGSITSENLSWNEISPYYDTLRKEWEQSLITSMAQGWRAPIMHDRVWFHQFITSTNINLILDLKNVLYGEKPGVSLSGKTFMQKQIFQFDVNDVEKKNQIYIRWNATQGYPFLSGAFRFTFSELSPFSNLWIPEEIFSSYNSAMYEYSFSSMGERAVDYVRTHKGEGSFALSKAVLKPGLPGSSDKDLPVNWDTISGSFKRSGSNAWLYGITAESALYKGSARGTWTHSLKKPVWEFTPQYKKIKPDS